MYIARLPHVNGLMVTTIAVLTAASADAAEFYVDIESRGGLADDASAGTLLKPWRTLGRAVGAEGVGPGDTVWVRGGTYRERVRLERGGEEGRPLMIKAFRREKPVIDGGGIRNGVSFEADQVTIEGLGIRNLAPNATAVLVTERTGIVLRKLDVSGARMGVWLHRASSCQVLLCTVHDCEQGLIYIDTACSDIVVADNHVYGNVKGHGIVSYAPGNGVRGQGEVSIVRVNEKLARFSHPKLALHKARRGTLFGQNPAGTVKHPCLVLFFDRPMATQRAGTWTTDRGIAGGTVRLADGRDWFVLRNNHDWGNKPYSPDGTQGLFEIGDAKWADLAKAKYAWVTYVFDPACANRDIQILRNHVHDVKVQGIWLQRTENALIRGNRLHSNGATGIQIESLCRRIWIENNMSYANNLRHIHETGIWLDETIDAVVQNNVVYENQKGMGITQCEWVLMRRNVLCNNQPRHVPEDKMAQAERNSGAFWFSGGRGYHLGAPPGAKHNAFVHNTLYNNGADSSLWGGLQHGCRGYPKTGRNHFINNIVHNHHGALLLDSWCAAGIVDGNIYHGSKPLTARWRGEADKEAQTYLISEGRGLTEYRRASGLDAHSQIAELAFVNPQERDFRLAPGSAAIDGGQSLTRTRSAGSGTRVPVEDVTCFSAGYRTSKGKLLIPGDEITVAGRRARIMAIDREAAILTLDQEAQWPKGAPVAYAYKGSGPDVGAFEVH